MNNNQNNINNNVIPQPINNGPMGPTGIPTTPVQSQTGAPSGIQTPNQINSGVVNPTPNQGIVNQLPPQNNNGNFSPNQINNSEMIPVTSPVPESSLPKTPVNTPLPSQNQTPAVPPQPVAATPLQTTTPVASPIGAPILTPIDIPQTEEKIAKPIRNFESPAQQELNQNTIVNDELLKTFIGANYEKITTKQLNFSGLFFNIFYLFYRKMFAYGILISLIIILISMFIKNYLILIAIALIISVAIGLLINKMYLSYANKKIEKIKQKNADKTSDEIKEICQKKGGTSILQVFLGLISIIALAIVLSIILVFAGISILFGNLLSPTGWNINVTNTSNSTNNKYSKEDGILLSDVTIEGEFCFNSKCTVTIKDSTGATNDYVLSLNNTEVITKLSNYEEYVKLDVYYVDGKNEKAIVDYKIYLKSNNEEISGVSNENELREKIGLYGIGTYTETLTLKKIGDNGIGMNDDETYNYKELIFTDTNNISYEMKYINPDNDLNLTENNEYKVSFEVKEGSFDCEYIINSIE